MANPTLEGIWLETTPSPILESIWIEAIQSPVMEGIQLEFEDGVPPGPPPPPAPDLALTGFSVEAEYPTILKGFSIESELPVSISGFWAELADGEYQCNPNPTITSLASEETFGTAIATVGPAPAATIYIFRNGTLVDQLDLTQFISTTKEDLFINGPNQFIITISGNPLLYTGAAKINLRGNQVVFTWSTENPAGSIQGKFLYQGSLSNPIVRLR